jgi:small nuclear ribonucleoprotein B and B'
VRHVTKRGEATSCLWNRSCSSSCVVWAGTVMAAKRHGSKMMQFLNYRMRVTLHDGRALVGTFLAFDRHMNIVLGDCDEFRVTSKRAVKRGDEREEKRPLGLVLLRGETVVSLSVDAPPPAADRRVRKPAGGSGAPGAGVAGAVAAQAAPQVFAPAGLAGPVAGVGMHASAPGRFPGPPGGFGPGPMGGPPPGYGGPPPGFGGPGGMPPPGMGMGPGGPGFIPPGVGLGPPPGGMGGPPPGMGGPPPGMGGPMGGYPGPGRGPPPQ